MPARLVLRPLGFASVLVLLAADLSHSAGPVSIQDLSPEDALQQVSLARGRVVVFHLYASWCPPCREEFPGLNKLPAIYRRDPVTILAFSLDQDRTALEKFLQSQNAAIPAQRIVAQKPDDFTKAFRKARLNFSDGIPYTAIFDRSGTRKHEWTGAQDINAYILKIDPLLKEPLATGDSSPPSSPDAPEPAPSSPRVIVEEALAPPTPVAASSSWLPYLIGLLVAGLVVLFGFGVPALRRR